MTDQANVPQSGQAIDVGIYGCTNAGKTRFLFQLLNGWERTRRLLGQSDTCQRFLATVENEIEKHDGSRPTLATTEGIRVKVRRDGNEAPWELVFRDLRGELLSGELDNIATLNRNGAIPAQVRLCDGFLFLFDPASSEIPSDIDIHHKRELKRAAMFIEYILKERQNRHLPIIFVLTHLDKWEHDEKVCEKARQWVEQVHGKLTALYGGYLRRHCPPSLTERSKTAMSVSSIRGGEVEQVVGQVHELVEESRKFASDDRRRVRSILAVGLAFTVLLAVLGAWIVLSGEPDAPPGPKTSVPSNEKEVLTKLDELDAVLNVHPRGANLPSVEEAKKVNHHLRWLSLKLELGPDGMTGLSEKTQQRMRSSLASGANAVKEKAESKDHPPARHAPVLAAYLEDLPDLNQTSPALAAAQTRYWQVQRAQVVEQVSAILKRRHEVASPPVDTLSEVISKLRDLEQETGRCRVFGPQARQALVEEIQTAATFCQDRKNSKNYGAKFRVVSSAYVSAKKAELAWRGIKLRSPGKVSVEYPLEPTRKSDTEVSYRTERESDQIALGLGTPVICSLYLQDSMDGDKWRKLHDFDLTIEQGPLASIGLPLVRPGQAEITKVLRWEGMELNVEFSGFPRVPALLWDAAANAKERKRDK